MRLAAFSTALWLCVASAVAGPPQSGERDDRTLSDALESSPEARSAFQLQQQTIQLGLREIADGLAPIMPINHGKMLRSARFVIDVDGPVGEVRAVRGQGNEPPAIQFSYLFVSLANMLCSIGGTMDVDDISQEKKQNEALIEKFEVIARIILAREQGTQPDPQLVQTFKLFWQRAAMRSFMNEDNLNKMTGCATEILAFALLHELNHLIENDVVGGMSPARQRAVEMRADRYAGEILAKAKMSVFSGTTMLLFFSIYDLERTKGLPDTELLRKLRVRLESQTERASRRVSSSTDAA